MSVTGEALKGELAQRWFAAKPTIKLVNAYGLTETSDDTNHEVLDRAPDGRTGPARPAREQRAHLRRRRVSVARAARRPRRDRLLRNLCRSRLRQRPRAHPAGLHGRSVPRGSAALPRRRLWTMAARRQAGVPWPPGYPGQALRFPDRDWRNREHPFAGAGCPRRRGGRRRTDRPEQASGGFLRRPAAAAGRHPAGPPERVVAHVHGPDGFPVAGQSATDR